MAAAALAAVQGISPTSFITPRAFLINNYSHITHPNSQCGYSSGGARYYRLKWELNRGPVIGFQKKRHYSSIYRIRAADEPMKPPYNVLITGSSKGIGYALAKEFLRADDRVQAAIENLKNEFGDQHLWGTTCDVRDGESVRALVEFARKTISYVDIWINNAGSNAYSYKPLMETSDEALMEVVTTNTLGTMICCREAIKMMLCQPRGGHVFNMDGAGADGRPTPRFVAYGATKRSLVHLTKSLQAELRMQEIKKVMVHNLSPGMVTTDLLMSGSNTKQAKFFINVLAEPADTVAEFLVPRIRAVPVKTSLKPTYIRFLTGFKAYSQILTRLLFNARKDRYVPED
ncbi:chlorophyll(ide) b reductase NOL, chloroplastic isoform X2 [Cryptomeria japonica]|uniref:chlorophyll(ide) b reductase NOL, chloroplastic isoform X2 n=1 Tax=Cryptomeria japonica TaxID=3369 RepID=UPI0027D9CEBF|nr:chlorophyll(ide) b reductase NOL, chloroplastic isoform X2 [Cryptomeria japonica]